MTMRALVVMIGLMAAGCSQTPAADQDQGGGNVVTLRNLIDTDVATQDPDRSLMRLQGEPVPTPSDRQTNYFLLRQRTAIGGTVVAMLREERGNRVAYARMEIDCKARLFRIAGVGSDRAGAEIAKVDGQALRSMAGLPLRVDLATYICRQAGTPLAPAES